MDLLVSCVWDAQIEREAWVEPHHASLSRKVPSEGPEVFGSCKQQGSIGIHNGTRVKERTGLFWLRGLLV